MVEDEEYKTGKSGLSSRTGMRVKETPATAEDAEADTRV
jgi:hypothetical protein